MADFALRHMGQDEFLNWLEGQERKHELVDGVPYMMTGTNGRHDRIVVNVLVAIANQLQGHRCRPFTSDTAIRVPSGNVRFPDLGIDCGTRDEHSIAADKPALVVEVLSPSTRTFNLTGKLDEYRSVESLTHIVYIDPDAPRLRLYQREDRLWQSRLLEGLDAALTLPSFRIVLRLAAIYDGLAFSTDLTQRDLIAR